MRHSCISFLSISLFLLTACSGEKGSHEQVSTVSIDKASNTLMRTTLRHNINLFLKIRKRSGWKRMINAC